MTKILVTFCYITLNSVLVVGLVAMEFVVEPGAGEFWVCSEWRGGLSRLQSKVAKMLRLLSQPAKLSTDP
jgi:hypothetical protein